MSDDAMQAIRTLAGSMRNLQRQPSRVGTFLCPRGQRRLFPRGHKNRAHPTRLCRHYWAIDPAATADYINAYREYWDSDAPEGQA
jgi:hypothetical protein